jgi:hypothetical protein
LSRSKPSKEEQELYYSRLEMEAIRSTETSVDFYRTTQPYITEDGLDKKKYSFFERDLVAFLVEITAHSS